MTEHLGETVMSSVIDRTTGEVIVTPLSPVLGAEISGVDLTRELTPSQVKRIRDAWNKYIVLVIRGQDLTLEQQKAFAANFGELGERKRAKNETFRKKIEGVQQTDPHTLLVSNIKVDGNPIGAFGEGEMWFHIDSGYAEKPYNYTFLYGLELPSVGGNTRFVNMYTVYDRLPEEIKRKIAGRKALHVHEYKRAERVDTSADVSDAPHFAHPIAVTHSESGRKSLFVDRLMTFRIEGMPHEESEDLLNYLFDFSENPEFIYEHEWKLKDLIMWDNRCTIHGRTWFPETENRLLRRCTVEGGPMRE
jgi:taurine dioxygenase